jgi:hypothetical protein
LTIKVFMVYRAYLAHEILEQWSSLVSEGGGVRAALAQASEGAKLPEQPKNPSDAANSADQNISSIEQQLGNARQGGALIYRSSAGTDILLDQKFPRPLAVGYRSVSHDFLNAAPSDAPE